MPHDNKDNDIEAWWVAMDERYDGSDCDSAQFVPDTGQAAWDRTHGIKTNQSGVGE